MVRKRLLDTDAFRSEASKSQLLLSALVMLQQTWDWWRSAVHSVLHPPLCCERVGLRLIHFPYATLVGESRRFFSARASWRSGWPKTSSRANLALLLGTGVLGAFTTMSTFSVETIQMFDQGESTSAMVYVLMTMMLSPVLALLGWKLAESVFS